ncbi:MAG: 30S ribosomal protein S2 [Deltaproteobacteria bacterium]|nr:30S ribosomal protein S2 [Deltaproteobacteria bacterium]
MANATVKEMLQAGLHFGHQTRRWNPKMKPYIYGPRNGIYIINLDRTKRLFDTACDFISDQVAAGGSILFVGTKRQAQAIIREEAKRCGMYYVDHRWLGGMMTNFQTIKTSVERLKSIESMQVDGSINRFPKKEILKMEKERVKLERNVGGIKDMRSLPSAVFVVDPKKEAIAVNEARKLKIPVIAITDTNCDPDGIDFLIPGNDDAIKSIRLISYYIAEATLQGQAARDGEEASEAALEAAMADTSEEMLQEETLQEEPPQEKTPQEETLQEAPEEASQEDPKSTEE